MEIVFPLRRNASAGKSTAQDCSSVIIWMEQILFLAVWCTAGITAKVCVSDWHLKYHP